MQRAISYLMLAALAVAVGIGLWPVKVDVFGNPSYSCGSGFIHSGHTWDVDSKTSRDERTADDTGTGTPKQLCPNKIYNNRDLALLIGAITLVLGLLMLALLQRPNDRVSQATLASMRLRGKKR